MHNSESETEEEEEFEPEKTASKEKAKSKTSKKEKEEKGEKPKKGRKQAEKAKAPKAKGEKGEKGEKGAKKKSKGKEEDLSLIKEQVFDYMQKQNRPYNLLNVFDNLHGKYKKPVLETVLNELAEEGHLTAKDFSKNRVYYLNQDKIDVSKETVEELGQEFTELRGKEMELAEEFKRLSEEHKKLISRKTITEIEVEVEEGEEKVRALTKRLEAQKELNELKSNTNEQQIRRG